MVPLLGASSLLASSCLKVREANLITWNSVQNTSLLVVNSVIEW